MRNEEISVSPDDWVHLNNNDIENLANLLNTEVANASLRFFDNKLLFGQQNFAHIIRNFNNNSYNPLNKKLIDRILGEMHTRMVSMNNGDSWFSTLEKILYEVGDGKLEEK